jgi:peptide/nickel transport system permease protein/oligopeptide transport system permease protein
MTDPRDEIELSPFGNEVVDLPATAVGTDPLQDARPDLAAGDGLTDVAPHRSFRKDAWARFRRNKLAMGGLVVVVLLVLVALFAPLIAPYGYDQIGPDLREGPSSTHWFGTDNIGRDVFSRVVYGARVSLVIGVLAILIDTVIGVTAGAVAAWYGRAADTLIMRTTDILMSIPYLVLAFAIITVVGRGVSAVVLTLGLTSWFATTRVLRSSILQQRNREYVEAARAIGCPDRTILFRHLLPNSVQPLIPFTAGAVGDVILAEAALSFIGVGVRAPTPSWGLMINEGSKYFVTSPYLLVFPGAAIFLTVLAFLFVGDGLRDALDTKELV